MLGLCEERYAGFTVKHFHEQMTKRHNYKLGHRVTRLSLQAAGLVRPAPKRSAHRRKRPRRALPGMMLQQDASRFARLPGQVGRYDLVVTLDDATSAIYSAFPVAAAGTLSSFRGIAEAIDQHGLFCELYTDRGSHYFDTPNAGEAVSKTVRTQVAGPWPSSASATLPRTRPKPAAVPSAPFEPSKTACPRSWPWRGSSPSKRPTAGKSGSGVHPVPPGRAPGRQRQHRQMAWVAAANPVDPIASPFRAHFVRAMVHVHEYPDGQLAIFPGPHRLAEYGPDGSPRDDAKLAA